MATYYPPPCLDFSGVPPGKPPISVHRTGKDVLPFREGIVVTTYMTDFLPPVLMPGYQGHIPTIAKGAFGNTFGAANKKQLQDYRHEILSETARPKFSYGRLPAQFSPWPDVAMAQRAIPSSQLSDTAKVRPKNFDKRSFSELNRFHQQCQDHRDFYLDKTDSVPFVNFFYLGRPYPTRCPVDERTFKIRRFQDSCDAPGYIGPPMNCGGMPCIKHQGFLTPFNIPKLPREPFLCDRVKPKDTSVHQVLLV